MTRLSNITMRTGQKPIKSGSVQGLFLLQNDNDGNISFSIQLKLQLQISLLQGNLQLASLVLQEKNYNNRKVKGKN